MVELKDETRKGVFMHNKFDQFAKECKDENSREIAVALLKCGDSPEKVAKVTKLPLAEVEKLAKELNLD